MSSEIFPSLESQSSNEAHINRFVQSIRGIRKPVITRGDVGNLFESGRDVAQHVMKTGPVTSRLIAAGMGKSFLDRALSFQNLYPGGNKFVKSAMPDFLKEQLDTHFATESTNPSALFSLLREKISEAKIPSSRVNQIIAWSQTVAEDMIEKGATSARELSEIGEMAKSMFPGLDQEQIAEWFISRFDDLISGRR